MSDAPHIVYSPHPDATPEAEISALAAVYRFVLDCRAQKEGPTAPDDDAKEFERRRLCQTKM